MHNLFQGEKIRFIEKQKVKAGVVCEVYSFEESFDKDLGIVYVNKHTQTPLQRILKGEKTVEGYMKGKGKLTVGKLSGEKEEYTFPLEGTKEVELHVGDTMQWSTEDTELVFYEVCYPPYEDGRFENLTI